MENCEFNLVKDGAGAGGCVGGKSGDPFIDRSKVRILLCDNDSRSSEEVCELLCKCSYQVTSVKSARQVIDALNAEGPDIDLILSEVDLPMKKGMKMLKYIMRHEDLKRIPVIMMSAQDEVSTVVKCLRLGAADYLVKPLRTNELLNLWTHMWRRRRMLGLAEKNILSYDFDLAASDPSDANTNSTTLFSDDTDDKSRKSVNPDLNLQTDQEVETNNADLERKTIELSEWHPSVPTISDHKAGQFSSFPKKSELKIGESSAFFTYVKSSMYQNVPPSKNSQDIAPYTGDSQPAIPSQEKPNSWIEQVNNASNGHDNGDAKVISSPGDEFPSSGSFLDSTSMERSCTPPMSMEFSKCSDEGSSKAHIHPRNGAAHFENSGFALHHPSYPYYMPQVMMTTPHHMYQKNLSDGQLNSTTSLSPALMSQYNHHQHQHQHQHHHHHHIQQCSQIPGTQSFPYYHVGLCLQPGQVPPTAAQQWHPSTGGNSSSVTASKPASKVDRREAALIKFRQKRKERCFDKKIRYVNRKKLAERRPRVRGQFVRKVNGVNVDLNGEPSPAELEDEDEEDDEEDYTDAALRGSSSMEDAL